MKWATALAVAAVTALVGTPIASASPGSGPELRVSVDRLDDSLRCHGDLGGGSGAPVLLIPGTTLSAKTNFDWNYEPALRDLGRSYCAVNLPGNAMGDIQIAAEYVVNALRTMHDRAHRRIDVVGFSQGGMISRWALKFWPDTRDAVEDLVGIDPSNHGTLDAYPICAPGCAPSIWQQRTGSHFLAALNAGQETYPGIDYTQMYTLTDEVVFPNLPPEPSSALRTDGPGRVRNIAVQSICPVHVAEHLSMGSIDPVAYALVEDAITHEGPADPSRVDRAVCTRALMPGVTPLTLPVNEARYTTEVATTLATYPHVTSEPKLAPYATRD
ncbi:esterase/lipase family protein [Pseudonocardia spinosispora]|uniref:esterase/lipase family protein n=1 Tax=Pseudonocardia spinosispora TaxID=103441 RepID=UPI000685E291|nr:lipase [Pseudonocardia spinosispora]